MKQLFPYVSNILSKFSLEVVPAVAASVLAGYLLTHFHLRGDPEKTAEKASLTVTEPAAKPHSEMTAGEDRKVTRELLRNRRDKEEPPAEVTKRVPSVAPEELEAAIKAAIADPPAAEPARAAAKPVQVQAKPEPLRAAVPEPPRRPDAIEQPAQPAQVAGQPILTPGNSGQLYTPPTAAQTLPTVNVASPPRPPTMGEPAQGPVGTVLSTASIATGKAVNAVGETVGWVVGLPGKIIGR
jgi:hypothetical protein